MKTVLLLYPIILTFILVFGGMYLVISFTKWEFTYIGDWEYNQRAVFVFLGMILWVITTCGLCAILTELRK